MALSSTIFVVEVDLADADRNVYETLSLRVARHPSESDEFLVARVSNGQEQRMVRCSPALQECLLLDTP